MDLSIVIVNYNTRELTINCIKSIKSSDLSYEYEIILVDNNSNDGSAVSIKSTYTDVVLIENNENVGFSKANNQAIHISTGRYVLLLNSDTVVHQNTLQEMLEFMDNNKEAGASGCEVVLPDGSLDKACHRGFPTPSASFYYLAGFSKYFPKIPRFNGYLLSHLDMRTVHEIDCLVGAFMLIRKETLDQVGWLDESFFMYGEDIDLCYRIKEAGWKILYNPYTSIIHYKGASSRKKPLKIVYEFHRAMIIFHNKHLRKKYSFFVNLMVYCGISLKLCSSIIFNEIIKFRR